MQKLATIAMSAISLCFLGAFGASSTHAAEAPNNTVQVQAVKETYVTFHAPIYADRTYNNVQYFVERGQKVDVYCWDSEYDTNKVYVHGRTMGWIHNSYLDFGPLFPYC